MSDPRAQPPILLVMGAFIIALTAMMSAPMAVSILWLGVVDGAVVVGGFAVLAFYAWISETVRIGPRFDLMLTDRYGPARPRNGLADWVWHVPDNHPDPLIVLLIHCSLLVVWIGLLPGRFLGRSVRNMLRRVAEG